MSTPQRFKISKYYNLSSFKNFIISWFFGFFEELIVCFNRTELSPHVQPLQFPDTDFSKINYFNSKFTFQNEVLCAILYL